MKKQLTINKGVWSVRPGFDNLRSSEYFNDNNILETKCTNLYYTVDNRGRGTNDIKDTQSGVCIVNIRGHIFPRSSFYYALEDYKNIIDIAIASDNIKAVILLIDSPGGMVTGVSDFAAYISNVSQKKPVYAVVDGMCCSAAYWIASSCSAIYATNSTTEFGSIGVMSIFVDDRLAWKQAGLKRIELNSTLSPNKSRISKDVLDGKYEEYIAKHLDPLASTFISCVKAGRSSVSDTALSGEVYFASEAQSLGLVDGIICLEAIVDKILNNIFDMSNLSNLVAALGVERLESNEQGIYLNSEQLEILDSALAPSSVSSGTDNLPTTLESTSSIDTETIASRINALEDRISAMEISPAASGGGAATGSDFKNISKDNWDYVNNSK